MSYPSSVQIRRLEIPIAEEIEGLSDLLRDCVEGGASVGFMVPLTRGKAEAFWRSVLESAARGERVVLVAEEATCAILGTVQVIWAPFENQPHRADVAKMLVHRRARRQGIGAALLAAAEHCALSADRTLLVLDTASSDAERLYVRQGWQCVGAIPRYALWPAGGFCSTTIFFKELRRGPS
jgi:GNAT superfamily N-acetyltransferase